MVMLDHSNPRKGEAASRTTLRELRSGLPIHPQAASSGTLRKGRPKADFFAHIVRLQGEF
jgi:hypothetical protein